MSYLSAVTDKGENITFNTEESLVNPNGMGGQSYDWLFREALIKKVQENEAAGKSAFADIDFPDLSAPTKNYYAAGAAMEILTDKRLKDKLLDYLADSKNNPEPLLKFINGGMEAFDFLGWSTKKTLNDVVHNALKRRVNFGTNWLNGVPLETLVRDAAASERDPLLNYVSADWMAKRLAAGEKVTCKTASSLTDMLKNSWNTSRLSKELLPLLQTADVSKLSDEEKNRLAQMVQGQHLISSQRYYDFVPAGNLAFADLTKRSNVTFAEVADNYHLHHSKADSEDNDKLYMFNAMKDVYRQGEATAAYKKLYENLLLDCYESGRLREGWNFERSSAANAYAANPERLQKLGMNIPVELVVHLLKKTEITDSPNFKFVLGCKSKDYPNWKFDKVAALNEVAEKGFGAGYAAEAFVSSIKKELDEGKSLNDFRKKAVAENHNNNAENIKLGREIEILREMERMMRECCNQKYNNYTNKKAVDIDDVELQRRMLDAAMGKRVPPLVCSAKKSSGLKRMFMSKRDKTAEDKLVAAEHAAYDAVNKLTAQFAHDFANSPLLPKDAQSPASYLYNARRDRELKSQDLSQSIRLFESRNAERLSEINAYDSLEAAYQKAAAKLEYQYNLQKEARETSGVKDAEYDSDFNSLEEKEKLRAEHPEMSARELYGVLRKKRNLEAKSPDKPVKLTTRQMSKLKSESRE